MNCAGNSVWQFFLSWQKIPRLPVYTEKKDVTSVLRGFIRSLPFSMPKDKKKRKDTSESDSESGNSSDEPKKPPAKKQKSSAAKSKSENDEPQWHLAADKVIKIREFKGKLYIDIRQYYNGPSGDLLPTKKGISLTPEQYQKFKKLISEIDEELAKF